MGAILSITKNPDTDSVTLIMECPTSLSQRIINRTVKIDRDLLDTVQLRCVSFIAVPRRPSVLNNFTRDIAMYIHSKSQHTESRIGLTISIELTKALIDYATEQAIALETMDTNPEIVAAMIEEPEEKKFKVLARNVEIATRKEPRTKILKTLDEYQLERDMQELDKADKELMALTEADQKLLDDMNSELKNLFS